MHLCLVALNKYCSVLTIRTHAKLAATLLEEQKFFMEVIGNISNSANTVCDGLVLGGGASKDGTDDGNENTLASANSNGASDGALDGAGNNKLHNSGLVNTSLLLKLRKMVKEYMEKRVGVYDPI